MIVDKLTFLKGNERYAVIKEAIRLDTTTYLSISIDEVVKKVLLPGNSLEIFSTHFSEDYPAEKVVFIRAELSELSVRADGRDIYNNKVSIERSLSWFARHAI